MLDFHWTHFTGVVFLLGPDPWIQFFLDICIQLLTVLFIYPFVIFLFLLLLLFLVFLRAHVDSVTSATIVGPLHPAPQWDMGVIICWTDKPDLIKVRGVWTVRWEVRCRWQSGQRWCGEERGERREAAEGGEPAREKGREGSGLWWWTGNLQGHEFFSRLHPRGYKDSYRCKEAGCRRHLFSTGTLVSMPPPHPHPLLAELPSYPSHPLSSSVLPPGARLLDCQQMQKRGRETENESETVFFSSLSLFPFFFFFCGLTFSAGGPSTPKVERGWTQLQRRTSPRHK